MAAAIASSRLCTPSLRYTARSWVLTVFRDTNSDWAMSSTEARSTIVCNTRSSLRESGGGEDSLRSAGRGLSDRRNSASSSSRRCTSTASRTCTGSVTESNRRRAVPSHQTRNGRRVGGIEASAEIRPDPDAEQLDLLALRRRQRVCSAQPPKLGERAGRVSAHQVHLRQRDAGEQARSSHLARKCARPGHIVQGEMRLDPLRDRDIGHHALWCRSVNGDADQLQGIGRDPAQDGRAGTRQQCERPELARLGVPITALQRLNRLRIGALDPHELQRDALGGPGTRGKPARAQRSLLSLRKGELRLRQRAAHGVRERGERECEAGHRARRVVLREMACGHPRPQRRQRVAGEQARHRNLREGEGNRAPGDREVKSLVVV